MSNQPVSYDNKLAQDFADLKTGAKLTPRLALDRLSAGTPPLDDETWRVLQVMFNGDETPEAGRPPNCRRALPPGTSRRWQSKRQGQRAPASPDRRALFTCRRISSA